MWQIKDKIVIHYYWCGFGYNFRFNSGNPYKSWCLGFIRIDVFWKRIGY